MSDKHFYLAGPMRGYPRFNFDAFDAAALDLRGKGFAIRSPADIDREAGFNPDQHTEDSLDWDEVVRRDVEAVIQSQGVIVLPGWEKSQGTAAEIGIAKWMGKPVLIYPTLRNIEEEDVLEEALRLTKGARQNSYGPPDQDFAKTAALWSVILGAPIKTTDVALCMIALKISRATWAKKRDNWTDIAGYARCGFLCEEAASQRDKGAK